MGLIRACLSCFSGGGARDWTTSHARPVEDTQVATAPSASGVFCATSPTQECRSVQAVRNQLFLECGTSIISAFALSDGRLIYQNSLSKAWLSAYCERGSCVTLQANSSAPDPRRKGRHSKSHGSARYRPGQEQRRGSTVPTSTSGPLLAWDGLHIPHLSHASGSRDGYGEAGLVLGSRESAAGGRVAEGCTANVLAHVFALEPQKLACMLQELSQSGSGNWKGVIRVPAVPLPADGAASTRHTRTQLTSAKGPAGTPVEALLPQVEQQQQQQRQQQDACPELSPGTRARARIPHSASGASHAASQQVSLVPWHRSWADPSSRPLTAPDATLAAPNLSRTTGPGGEQAEREAGPLPQPRSGRPSPGRPPSVPQHSNPSAAPASGAPPSSSAPVPASPSPTSSLVTAGAAAARQHADPWDVGGARAPSGSHAANIPSGSARCPSSSRLPSLATSTAPEARSEAGHSLVPNPLVSGALATSTLGLALEREPSLVKSLELRKLEAAALAFTQGPGGLHKHHAQQYHSQSPQQQSPEQQARRLHAAVGSLAPSPRPTTSGTWLTHQPSTEFPAHQLQLNELLGAHSQPLPGPDALLSWGRDRDSAACSAASGRPSAGRAPVVPSGASHRTSASPFPASVRLHDLLSYQSFTTPTVSPSDRMDAQAASADSVETGGAAVKEMAADPATQRAAWEQQQAQGAGRQAAEDADKDLSSHGGLLPPPTASRPSSVLPNLLQLLPPLLEADERSVATSGGASSGPSSTTKLSIRLMSAAARTRSSSHGRSNTPLPCAPRLDAGLATGGAAAGPPMLSLSALDSGDAIADAGALGPWVLGAEEDTEHDARYEEPVLPPPPLSQQQQQQPRAGRAASSSGTCSTSAPGTWGNTRASSFLTHNTDSHTFTTGHSSPNSKPRVLLSHFPEISSPGVLAPGSGSGKATVAIAAPRVSNSPAAPVQPGPGAVLKGQRLMPHTSTSAHVALPVATPQLPQAPSREDEALSCEPLSGLSPSEEAVALSPLKAAAVPLTRQQRSSWQGYPPRKRALHGAEAGPSEAGGGAGCAGNTSGRGLQGRTVSMWELDAWTVAALRSLPRSQTSTTDVTAHIPEEAALGRHGSCERAACHGQDADALGERSGGCAGRLPAAGAVSGCNEGSHGGLLPLSGAFGQQSGAAASVAPGVDGRGGGPTHRWHRVTARRAVDPVTGELVVVLVQDDVTAKVLVESHVALVMEAEHRLLEQLFPQRVLRRLTEGLVAEQRLEAAEREAAAAGAVGAASRGSLPGRTQSVKALGARCGERTTLRQGRVSRPGDVRLSAGRRGSLQGSLPAACLGLGSLATHHPCVTLLQSDVKGFTPMAKDVPPHVVMVMLNDLFSRFDALLDVYGVRKIETIGDAYVVAGGLASDDDQENDGGCDVGPRGSTYSSGGRQLSPRSAADAADAAYRVFCFAKAMLRASRHVLMPHTGRPVEIRVGMHSGPVVSGVVGSTKPKYCLFGAAVAATSRLESGGEAGAVHLSATCRQLVEARERDAQWAPGPGLEVKGGPLASFLYRL